jgi:hypothetical protein
MSGVLRMGVEWVIELEPDGVLVVGQGIRKDLANRDICMISYCKLLHP